MFYEYLDLKKWKNTGLLTIEDQDLTFFQTPTNTYTNISHSQCPLKSSQFGSENLLFISLWQYMPSELNYLLFFKFEQWFFFPWNYGFSFSSSFSTQNSPLVFLSSLNTMIHITNCISFIILKKFLLEMFRLLTLHHWYPAVISGLLCHHLGFFFFMTLFHFISHLFLSFAVLLC